MDILKFNEFIAMNEGVESVITFSELSKLLYPFGWRYKLGTGGRCIFSKGDYTITFHLKHGGSMENRKMDVGGLDRIRGFMIKDFEKTGDPSEINAVPWEEWRLPNPFNRELSDYDSETGLKKSDVDMMNNVEIVDQLFKNVYVIKNQKGEYNLCRSESDKRPLLDRWYPLYQASKQMKGKMCLGYAVEDMEADDFGENLFEIKKDGTLGEIFDYDYVIESIKK